MNTTSMDVGPTVAGEPNISTVEKLERKTYVDKYFIFFQRVPVHPKERALHAQRESKLSVDVGPLRMSLLSDELTLI